MCQQDLSRGSIKWPERYKQLISYEGLERHRHITPTDIDGMIDYNGNAFLYFECKHGGKYNEEGLDYGQKRALENIINSHIKANKISMVIVFIHYCAANEIIMAKEQSVVEIYWQGRWSKTDPFWNVLDAINWFENYCKNKEISI